MLADKKPGNIKEPASMTRQSSYTYNELIQCGHGELFGPGNAQLPLPNMLMLDRITSIADNSGEYNKGIIQAENSPDRSCHQPKLYAIRSTSEGSSPGTWYWVLRMVSYQLMTGVFTRQRTCG
jgi:hypothetical protein